ncbi:MAG TPA: asparagine synthase (glutamine-hydrolyzing) [Chthonomonadales bacterium]|nr:asparagine synthase (glutamine-hydrolyzing) [Chthonomonadales bacterium]
MCGIVGALSFKGSSFEVCESFLQPMRDEMVHRGPDGAGIWISADARIGLGFRRLAIIDLSPAADQPMSNEDGSIQLVFNGEIYNHADIRKELLAIGGHCWKTDHSDTEVIVHAFEEWGIDCLQKMRGMFAMAIWDGRKRQLWLVRDRIGIKPLYYSIHSGRLCFASEIKALLRDPGQSREVDEESFYHYLSFLVSPAPRTLFRGVNKLPGGSWMRIDEDGAVTEQRYWDALKSASPLTELSDCDIASRLLATLRESVQLRKVSDVPVGVFLSGGLDSSTNAALFSEGAQSAVKTFSIGYEGEYQTYSNELGYARRVANLIGAEQFERKLTEDDLLDFLPDMVRLQDEPIGDPVCVPVYYVAKLAREHGVIVAQVGEGSDELFCGYPRWKQLWQLQHYAGLPVPRAAKKLALAALRAGGKDLGFHYEWLRRSALAQPIFWGGAEAFSEAHKQRLLSPRLRAKFRGLTSWDAIQPIRTRFEEAAWQRTPLSWMTYLDLNLRLPELLLMRVDKMSMAVSLEGRVPFLDHKLVELAMGIPEEVKTRNGELKYILKKAVRGVIPDDVIDRPKQGFGVPVYEWFFNRLGARTREVLDRFCSQTDFLNRDYVFHLLDSGAGPAVWYLLNFAMWWQEYIQ